MRQRALLLTFSALAIAGGFVLIVLPSCATAMINCLPDPNAPPIAPYVYRLLPGVISRLLAPDVSPYSLGGLYFDMLLQMAIVFLTIPPLYVWLRRWLDVERAIIGMFVFSVVYLLAQHLWYRSVGTALEILFVCWALVLIDCHWGWLVLIAVLAALNRETSVFIGLIYAAYHGRKRIKVSIALVVIWAVITAYIHLAVGAYPHVLGALGTLEYNLANMWDNLFVNTLLLPLVAGIVMGYRTAPLPLKWLTWVAFMYVGAVAVGGSWNEVLRLLLPILPLVIPILLGQRTPTLSRATTPS